MNTTTPATKEQANRRKARMRLIVAAAMLTITTLFGSNVPASAAPSNAGIYLVAPQWGGFCPKGPGFLKYNKVTHVRYVNHTTGDSWGDSGDDIVWARVRLRQTNSITVAVKCRWNTPQGMNFKIYPTRNGQAVWVSTWGKHWKN